MPIKAPRHATPDAALDQLHELMHLYRAQMHGLVRDNEDGLAPMEARALGFFSRHPDSTASDLVQHSQRDKAQITRLVQLLLERGLLTSGQDPADRRIRRLRLTPAGEAVQRKMQAHRKRLAELLVRGFSEEELRDLLAYMGRLQANFTPPSDTPSSPLADPDRPASGA